LLPASTFSAKEEFAKIHSEHSDLLKGTLSTRLHKQFTLATIHDAIKEYSLNPTLGKCLITL
jgi:hypothetical protein